uniref:SFRICE_039629 n=1 Tax=Spodoptera frugiperda TaxID=7108 RepID=A0A2H1WZS5_SPOFR
MCPSVIFKRIILKKAQVLITTRNAAIQCTLTFHHLCYESHVIGDAVLLLRHFSKIGITTVILCPPQESNPKPLVRKLHLRPLGQRGNESNYFLEQANES